MQEQGFSLENHPMSNMTLFFILSIINIFHYKLMFLFFLIYDSLLSVAFFSLSFAEVSKYRNFPFYQSDSYYLFYFLLVILLQDKTQTMGDSDLCRANQYFVHSYLHGCKG